MRIILTLMLMGGIYTVMRSVDEPQAIIADVQGRAHVHDGDTITVTGVKIRLFGIDAPEYDQTCKMPDGTDWACGRWSRGSPLRCLARRRRSCL